MKAKFFYQWLNKISGRLRFVSLSLILCLSVGLVIMHITSTKSYSSPVLMGLASTLGMVAAIGLIYGLLRFKQ